MFLSRHNGENLLNSAQLVRPHFAATKCRIMVAFSMDNGETGRSLVSGEDRVRRCSSVVGLILSALQGIALLRIDGSRGPGGTCPLDRFK